MRQKFLEIAKLTKTQGLKGEMRAQYYCDDFSLLEELETLYFNKGDKPVKLEYAREYKDSVAVIKLEGVDSIEQAQKFVNKMLYMNREDVELPDDTFFIQDLIGLEVRDADNDTLYGTVDEVIQTAPTDVYSIKTTEGKQLLFPAIPEVLIETDIDGGKLLIRPLEGLFE